MSSIEQHGLAAQRSSVGALLSKGARLGPGAQAQSATRTTKRATSRRSPTARH